MQQETEPRETALEELARDDSSRKAFLRMLGGGAAAGGLSLLLAACGSSKSSSSSTSISTSTPAASGASTGTSTAAAAPTGTDVDIVKYALTLEYIESAFYEQVIASGMVKDAKTLDLAKSIAQNEKDHVGALTALVKSLNASPPPVPKTKFDTVIEGGPKMILQTAATVENLGAAAYLGQASNIMSKDILVAALSIHSVEARHAAALNSLVGRGFQAGSALEGSIPDGAFAKPMTMEQVLDQVKPFLAS